MKNGICFLMSLTVLLAGGNVFAGLEPEEETTSTSEPVLVQKDYQVVEDEVNPDTLYKSVARAGETAQVTYRGAKNNGVPYTKLDTFRGGEAVYRWRSSGKIAQVAKCLNVTAIPPKDKVRTFVYEREKTVTKTRTVEVPVEVPVEVVRWRVRTEKTYVLVCQPQAVAVGPQAVYGGQTVSYGPGISACFGGRSKTTISNVVQSENINVNANENVNVNNQSQQQQQQMEQQQAAVAATGGQTPTVSQGGK